MNILKKRFKKICAYALLFLALIGIGIMIGMILSARMY